MSAGSFMSSSVLAIQKLNQPNFLDNIDNNFPQQCKLTRSSAQNSSGVHWCRRRVRFTEVPEEVLVLKVPENIWEALVQSQVRFNGVREKVLEKVWVRLQKVPEKVPEKVPVSLSAKPSQVLQGSGEGSRASREGSGESSGKGSEEGLGGFGAQPGSTGFLPEKVPGGFGAEPGQVQQGSGEGCGEGLEGFGAEPG